MPRLGSQSQAASKGGRRVLGAALSSTPPAPGPGLRKAELAPLTPSPPGPSARGKATFWRLPRIIVPAPQP